MTIPSVPLSSHKYCTDEKKGLFNPEYVAARSKWVRPSIAGIINPRDSVGKLAALGFDPIEAMVRKFDEIQTVIDQIMLSNRPSMVALTSLYGIQQKISNDLMKYGYSQVPANTDTPDAPEATRIIYTDD